jgi:hypothetical protein
MVTHYQNLEKVISGHMDEVEEENEEIREDNEGMDDLDYAVSGFHLEGE